MSKRKLLRRGEQAPSRVSKTFNVKDESGNKMRLKATVVSVNKAFNSTAEEDQRASRIDQNIIPQILPMHQLSMLTEMSTELQSILDSLSVGIDGFGYRLIPRIDTDEFKEKHKSDMDKEKEQIIRFFDYVNPNQNLTQLRKETRAEKELTGNAYWELVPNRLNPNLYDEIRRVKSRNMYIMKLDSTFTKCKVRYVGDNGKIKSKTFMKRFRKFVQIIGKKKVYFKEMGDPRIIDHRTGEVKKKLDKKYQANEILHWKVPHHRESPYGLPRYAGNIISIEGSRQSDESNIVTMTNNHVPSMVIMANGGYLTKGSIQRVQQFVDTQIKDDSNYSKFLILEGEPNHDSLSSASSVKIDIKPLTENQHTDQVWQEYDKNNAGKLRRNFRQAPIFQGHTDNYDRATAQESERMTEKYVYNPEREDEDYILNKLLVSQGYKYWKLKSNSPNVTNDEDIVKILANGEKSGGLTPRISRMLLEDVLNRELPPVPNADPEIGWNPDLPFSFTLARLMHEAGQVNQNGTMNPQGQTPKRPGVDNRDKTPEEKMRAIREKTEKLGLDWEIFTDTLKDITSQMDSDLDKEVFGMDYDEI